MKINVRKFSGGASLQYMPLPDLPSRGIPPEAPEEDIDNSELKGMKALTSDSNAFFQTYKRNLNLYESLPSYARSTAQGRMLRSQLRDNQDELIAMANSKQSLDAIAADKKKALPEYAVFQGHVVTKDRETGDIVNMSLPEYSANLASGNPKYKALTNGELMDLRASDIRFAGNDAVLPILYNAVATEDVVKNIRGILQNLGSYSKGTADVSYEDKQVEEGSNALLNQGLSYVKTTSGELNASNAENIKAAGNAMWSMLDEPSKDLLRMKAVNYNIYPPEQIENAAMGLALALLKPAITEKIQEKSGEALGKIPGAKTPGTSTGKKVDLDYWSGIATGKSGASEDIVQLDGGGQKVTMKGRTFAPFMKDKNSFYGETTLDKINQLGAIGDMNNVYFGDQKIDASKMNSIVYDGKAKPAVVWMPFTPTDDGGVQPDLDRNSDLEEIRQKIKDGGITDPTIKAEMYKQGGFQNFDNSGEPTQNLELMPFVTFSAYSNTLAFDQDSKWYDVRDDMDSWYKHASAVGEKGTSKEVLNPQYYNLWWSFEPNALKGMVYVPLSVGASVGGMYASGNTPQTGEDYTNIATYQNTRPGGLGGPRTITQLDKNIKLDKEQLNKTN